MNRIYRLVWNRALRTVQVASELASAPGAAALNDGMTSTRRRPLAVAVAGLLLSMVSLPAFADCTPTNVIDCGAPGGFDGHPGRNMHGGTGDGTGGSATQRDTNGTSEVSGGSTSNGAGGRGADGIEYSTNPATVAAGGAGGAVGATGFAALGTTVTGGAGQAGASPPTSVDFWAGGGGGGGAGVFVNDSFGSGNIGAATIITGGWGGDGGSINAVENGDAGGGGGGGAGVIVGAAASGATISISGSVAGGVGGSGGSRGYAGSGGGGGDALLMLGGSASINVYTGATVQGGAGGPPGTPSPYDPVTGAGGQVGGYGGGGAGVNMVGAGDVLTSSGSIVGGGTGGSGVAGVGVRAWGGALVTTSGLIAGGINGDGVQADAVLFSGGGNVIDILGGASFTGNIESTSGTVNGGDTLGLVGSIDGSIDAGQVVGFAQAMKEGSGTWTLTGSGNSSMPWMVDAGELLGDSHALTGSIIFGEGGSAPTVAFAQDFNGTYAGTISGSGNLIKSGSGTLTLAGNLAGFSGGFAINGGAVTLTGDGDLHGAELSLSNAQLYANQSTGSTVILKGLSGLGGVTLGTGSLVLDDPNGDTFDGVIQGAGGLALNDGTQTLTGANTYAGGTTLLGGTLKLTGSAQIGQGQSALQMLGGDLDASGLTPGSTLDVASIAGTSNVQLGATTLNVEDANGIYGGVISGTGGLTINNGLQTLAGVNTYSGDTTIDNATIYLEATGQTGPSSRLVLDNGTFDMTGAYPDSTINARSLAGTGLVTLASTGTFKLTDANDTFAGVISGAGALEVAGGREVLDGSNTYTGATTVDSGATLIVGEAGSTGASLAGSVAVNDGTFGGNGTVKGSLTISGGGTLAPGDISSLGTLTVNGDLTINDGSQLDFDFAAPGPNFSTPGQSDHVVVGGNLTINASTLNVTDLGMGPGLYTLFSWGGALPFNNGGFQPPAGDSLQILSTDKQINLIDAQGVTLDVWNANGLASSGSMGGGSGTWSLTSPNWTDTSGLVTGAMSPMPGFAIFGGASGTVTIDNTNGNVSATGMQFMSDGYRLTGDALTLVGVDGAAPIIRVSAGATAIIDNLIDGNNGLDKTDAGTLVLNGANIYTGNTVLTAGELSVSSDLNLGLASNAIDFEGGTLQITGNTYHSTARNIILGAAGGGFDIADADNTFTVSQALTGAGGLYKTGAGTLVLAGNNTYTGETQIAQGTLQASTTSLRGDVLDDGTLVLDQASDATFGGTISGTGQFVKTGAGMLTLSGTNTYSGGTSILAGGLTGTTLSLQGAVANNGELVFDQSFDGTFTGNISGSGQFVKNGTGTVILVGSNSYTGGTLINAGTLQGDSASVQGNVTDNGTLAFAQTSNGVFAGAISGSGGVVKSGAGTLVLTGANTYGGGTTITTGTLQGDAGSLQGSMIDNATLAFAQVTDGTFAGVISGTGALVKQGAGTLTLSGANTYGGGTTVLAGTLKGNTASLQGAMVDDATLVFDQATDGSFDGVVSGTGQLVKDGAGTLTLGAANTYSGGTIVNAGNLQGDTTSLRGAILDNAVVTFAQDSDATFSGAISGSGQLVKSGTGTLTLAAGNTYDGGTVVSGGALQGDASSLHGAIADNATLVFAQQADGVFDGTLSGSGQLTKNGSGTLVLDEANTFSGATEVTAGKLVVGDDTHADASLAGSVVVDSGATLGGIGSIGGLDLAGTLTPGNSIGTLHVNGNAVFRQGSSYQFEVSSDGTGDSLAATGAVSILGGSAVALANNGNWAPQTQFQIITATGGIHGQFASLTSSLAFLTPTLAYGANAVTLELTRNDVRFDDIAQTPNQKAVAAAIDPLGIASPIYKAVVGLDAATARQGFDAMSGEQFASTRSALIEDSSYVRDAIDRHLLGLHDDGEQATDAQGVTAWTSAWGHWGDNDSDGNAARLQSDGSGLLVGADIGVGSDARLGAVVGHRQMSMSVDDRGSNAHANTTDLGLYGDAAFSGFSLRGGLAYGWQRIEGARSVAFGNIDERLDDRYDAHVAHGFVEGSYGFALTAQQQLEPFLNLAHVHLQTDATQESGGATALTVAGGSENVSIATLGLRDTWSLVASGNMHAHLGIGWQQAWGDVTPVSTMRFASGSDSFDIAGTPVARHAGVVDGGLSFAVARNAFVDASYVGRFASGAKDQGARLSFTMNW